MCLDELNNIFIVQEQDAMTYPVRNDLGQDVPGESVVK